LNCPLPGQSAELDVLLVGRPEGYHDKELGIMDISKRKKSTQLGSFKSAGRDPLPGEGCWFRRKQLLLGAICIQPHGNCV